MAFPQGRALLIGVGSYAHAPKSNIPVSVADARRMKEILCDPALCGYLPEHVTLLHDEEATRDGVLAALDVLATTKPDDTVVVFYCGHGKAGTDGNYYLTTHDSVAQDKKVAKGTGISELDLLDKLRKVKAKRLLLLLNACYSGEVSPSLGDDEDGEDPFGDSAQPPPSFDAILSAGEGRIIITACRREQKSYIGAGPLTIFTQALVDGLTGAGYVPNNHGYVGAFGLYGHIHDAVKEAAAGLGKVQEPMFTALQTVGPFPVSLYLGARDLGAFDDQEPLPETTAIRRVATDRSRRMYDSGLRQITQIVTGNRNVTIGGSVTGSIITTGDNNLVDRDAPR